MGIELNRTAAGPAHVPISLSLPFHCESLREVHAPAHVLIPYLDDHAQLAAHMSKSSWMMLGSRMTIELDVSQGRDVGAHICLAGRALGIPLSVEEVVIERQPPLRSAAAAHVVRDGALGVGLAATQHAPPSSDR